jgi:hypothetical protein
MLMPSIKTTAKKSATKTIVTTWNRDVSRSGSGDGFALFVI